MNWKTSLALMIAIALGVVTTKVGWDLVRQHRLGGGARVKVVVAARNLDLGTQMTSSDVTTQLVTSEGLSPEVFKDTKDVVGRTIAGSVIKGQMLFGRLLAPVGSAEGLPALVPDGMRAVAVDVTESSSVGGLLTPGCHVDVIATLHQGNQSVARTIVEDARVMAVGKRMSKDAPPTTPVAGASMEMGMSTRAASKPEPVRSVTLMVTPKSAEAIGLASSGGTLRLVLRGNRDRGKSLGSGVRMEELLGEPLPRAPQQVSIVAKQPSTDQSKPIQQNPEPTWTVHIMHGANVTTQEFKKDWTDDDASAAPARGGPMPFGEKKASADSLSTQGKGS